VRLRTPSGPSPLPVSSSRRQSFTAFPPAPVTPAPGRAPQWPGSTLQRNVPSPFARPGEGAAAGGAAAASGIDGGSPLSLNPMFGWQVRPYS
jgi:hypothetical protein